MSSAVDKLRAMLARATPGPWRDGFHVGEPRALVAEDRPMVSLLGLDIDGMAIMDKAEDAALIVAAVNALPALLDVVRDAERLLRRIENTSFNYSEAELLARALAHLDATSPGAGREP